MLHSNILFLVRSCVDDCETLKFHAKYDSFTVDPKKDCMESDIMRVTHLGISQHTDYAFWVLTRLKLDAFVIVH